MSRMTVKCMVCEVIKELTPEELKENGEFVERRRLTGAGFLKVLSLDMREVCKAGKPHQWEFTPEFDKEIHAIAADVKSATAVIKKSIEEETEYYKLIDELNEKIIATSHRCDENMKKKGELLEKMKEIAYIGDETMWS